LHYLAIVLFATILAYTYPEAAEAAGRTTANALLAVSSIAAIAAVAVLAAQAF